MDKELQRHDASLLSGFTIIELLIAAFIIATVVTGLFGLFVLGLRSAQEGERLVVAMALANERMEMVRNLPYVEVGTVGGVPAGAILPEETVNRNGLDYTVKVDIRYVDDVYDGTVSGGSQEEEKYVICHKPPGSPGQQTTIEVGASALDAHLAHGDSVGACGTSGGDGTDEGDEYSADYKQVRVEVSWQGQFSSKPVVLISYAAPQGVEGSEGGGTLDFQALDAMGSGVAGATVRIINEEADPTIDYETGTNAEGRVVLPGLPPLSDSYHVQVEKDGYSSEQTYETTADFLPDVDHSPFSIILKQLTSKTFFIDRLVNISFQALDEGGQNISGVDYQLLGSNIIGTDGSGNAVYKTDITDTTTSTANNYEVPWDTYDLMIDGAATGYDIKETSLILPLTVEPGDNIELVATLVEHTSFSLQVAVVNGDDNPVDNATVHLTGTGYDETLGTGVLGQVFFSDLPNGDNYDLIVSASGFEDYEQSQIKVSEESRVKAKMTASGG
ncbi:MAG: carboxypeptidase regulatory-like domain-containing protein [Candidatus Andersenbacteria bacterium]|nr:carboxypeptidase regulatory-like domain-containing protein [bacterium]MDZ4225306.1 carboxypeptidase regulatory-like domain-containing protein [Candidatus Andersenbacteria bacterium]